MTIYIPVGIIGLIIIAVILGLSNRARNRGLIQALDNMANKDEYIVNTFIIVIPGLLLLMLNKVF
jgi:hypothetical protein